MAPDAQFLVSAIRYASAIFVDPGKSALQSVENMALVYLHVYHCAVAASGCFSRVSFCRSNAA